MLQFIYSVFFGLIQGLTEFMPVSSSGHLVILHKVFNFELKDTLSFDVVLHLGTLLALFIFFYRDIITYIKAFFKSLVRPNFRSDENQRMAWFILMATIPAVIFGYLLEDQAASTLRSPYLVASMLMLGGFLFIIFERFSPKLLELKEMKFSSALIIGFFQVLALIPGVSRSGITMVGGMSQKLKRGEAARFSFLLAIPVIFGAVVKRISTLFSIELTSTEIISFISGFLTALISGYFVIKYLLRFLRNHSLNIFAYYRFLLAILVIIYFIFINYD